MRTVHDADGWPSLHHEGRFTETPLSLADPSFPATVYARLIESEDGTHNLIWSRSKGD